jgi:hypothetical protein
LWFAHIARLAGIDASAHTHRHCAGVQKEAC